MIWFLAFYSVVHMCLTLTRILTSPDWTYSEILGELCGEIIIWIVILALRSWLGSESEILDVVCGYVCCAHAISIHDYVREKEEAEAK